MPRVLIVDDTETDRMLAGGLIEREESMTVGYAANGQEALTAMASQGVDLVLTDLVMPDMDGLELLAEVRQRHPLVPVVLMTAQGNEDLAVRALRAGAASYIPKTVLGRELAKTVRTVLEVSQENRSRNLLMRSMVHSESTFLIGNDDTLIGPLVNHLQRNLTVMGLCGESETMRVGVALEEALTNAIHHGNLEVDSELRHGDLKAYHQLLAQRRAQRPYRDRRVRLSADYNRERARFVVTDEGPGFDPDSLPDPTDPANLARPYGRGVLLIRTFMDQVAYNDVGNEVTMIKRCNSAPESE